jgi:hypothetical protein
MKREAASSSKMKKLCRKLNIRTYAAIGILESLWHLTAREAPQGDIGKLSDEDIALSIDWEGNELQLIEALVDSKWVDRSDQLRLIVHDWHEHSDDSLDMKLARAGKLYANGAYPRMSKISKKERDFLCQKFGWPCEVGAQKATEELEKPLPAPAPEPAPAPAPGEARERATAPPEQTSDFQDGEFPPGLGEQQYAFGILEHCAIVSTPKICEITAKSIPLLARMENLAAHKAAEVLEGRIKAAQARGDTVNAFWFEDSKWKSEVGGGDGGNSGNRGAAVGRVNRSLGAWDRAAERRGVRNAQPAV